MHNPQIKPLIDKDKCLIFLNKFNHKHPKTNNKSSPYHESLTQIFNKTENHSQILNQSIAQHREKIKNQWVQNQNNLNQNKIKFHTKQNKKIYVQPKRNQNFPDSQQQSPFLFNNIKPLQQQQQNQKYLLLQEQCSQPSQHTQLQKQKLRHSQLTLISSETQPTQSLMLLQESKLLSSSTQNFKISQNFEKDKKQIQSQTHKKQISAEIFQNESQKSLNNVSINFLQPSRKKRRTVYSQNKSIQEKNQQKYQDQLNFKTKNMSQQNKSNKRFSKPFKTQQVFNVRKTFIAKKYDTMPVQQKISQQKNLNPIEKHVYYQINKTLKSSSLNVNKQKKSLKSLNFPILTQNIQTKQMSFSELFQYEKKKMQNLKQLLSLNNLNGIEDFKLDRSRISLKENSQSQGLKRLLKNEQSLKKILYGPNQAQSENQNISQKANESKTSFLLYPLKGKTDLKSKTSTSYRKNASHDQTTNPQNNPQDSMPNENFVQFKKTQLNSMQRKKQSSPQISPQSKNPKKKIISNITTFNFDCFRKQKPQQPQIKELRSKYLYSRKRQLNKEDSSKVVFSIVSVHSDMESNSKKWKRKLATESYVQSFLQIEKIPTNSIQYNRLTNFTKQYIPEPKKQKNFRSIQSQSQKRQTTKKVPLQTFRQKFEPWQNNRQKYQNLDDDIFQYSH